MSELRQQLRKRGLPVSGTKPALLERLRPFQMPRPQLTPAPLCQLEGTLEPPPPPNLSPSSSPSQIYIQPSAVVEEGLANATYLTSPSSSASSSPNLQAPSPPVPSSALWRSEQAAEELTVELEMRERIRSRPRGKALGTVTQARKNTTLCKYLCIEVQSNCSSFCVFVSYLNYRQVEVPYIPSCNRTQDVPEENQTQKDRKCCLHR